MTELNLALREDMAREYINKAVTARAMAYRAEEVDRLFVHNDQVIEWHHEGTTIRFEPFAGARYAHMAETAYHVISAFGATEVRWDFNGIQCSLRRVQK